MSETVKKLQAFCRALVATARGRALLLAAGGLLGGLCVAFPVLGGLQWASLVPALVVLFLRATDPSVPLRKLYGDGLIFNYAFSLVVFHWFLYMYPLEFVTDYRIVALIIVLVATLGLSLLQALFGALVPVALALICRGGLVRRRPYLQVVILPALWCIREWGWTLMWAGVPWGRMALGQAELPIMLQTARWFGPYFLTFVILLVNGAIAYALLRGQAHRLCLAVAAGAIAFQTLCGAVLLQMDATRTAGETLTVAAIQGNIGSADKWNVGWKESYDIYYGLTEQAAIAGANIIVWPETAVPVNLDDYPERLEQLKELARTYQTVLLLGLFADGEEGAEYNAIRMIDADGTYLEDFYAKRHLVPFGEYVPLRPLIEILCPPLLQISQLASDVTPGEDAAVFDTAYGQVGSLICFDSIYEDLARDSVQSGAQLLSISTNDSWFFDSAAVYMHNAQAKLRAIETGRYVVRAANTGVSSVISPTGQELALLDALEEGVILCDIELREDTTLYTRIGDLWVYLCLAGVLIPLFGRGVEAFLRRRRGQDLGA